MYAMNNSDDRHDPCGTPSDGVLGSEKEMPTWTEYGLFIIHNHLNIIT
jgi:hypothetical protein